MNRLLSRILILVIITACLISSSNAITQAQEEGVVTFADASLEATIRRYINKLEGPIYTTDLEAIVSWFSASGVSDLAGIEYLVNVTHLSLYGQVDDISPLAALTKLEVLQLYNNRITDISPLNSLRNLTELRLDSNQISDVSPLAMLTNLTHLSMNNNQISDILPLASLNNLEYLELYNNNIKDVSPLATLSNLTHLNMNNNQVNDISPLASLNNLEYLNFYNNSIKDISPLATLSNLTHIQLSNNQISDISPLAELTKLKTLYLEANNISDIYALVENNGLSKNDTLFLMDNPLSDTSLDKYVPQLKKRGIIMERKKPVRFNEVFFWIPVGTLSTIASIFLFWRARHASQRGRRLVGLIIGFIGVIGFSLVWVTSNHSDEFSLFWYSGPITITNWIIYLALPLFVAVSLVITQKWHKIGGYIFIIASLGVGAVYLLRGSLWGLFYIPVVIMLLVSGIIFINCDLNR